MEIAQTVYRTTHTFPADEIFGLTSQMRRCSISIASNIAEGAGRQTTKEFIQFLHIAQGSLSELDTQLELALKLGYIAQEPRQTIDSLLTEEDKIISFEKANTRQKNAAQKRIELLEAKLQTKNEVFSELMEEHVLLKKDLGER